jgi:hypothetical protein
VTQRYIGAGFSAIGIIKEKRRVKEHAAPYGGAKSLR